MTGPIEVDATVKAMVELINRVAREAAVRRVAGEPANVARPSS